MSYLRAPLSGPTRRSSDVVMASAFLTPVMVPVKLGFGSPYSRLASAGVTVSVALVVVSLEVFSVTEQLRSLLVGSLSVAVMSYIPTALAGVAALAYVAVMA